LPDIHTLARLAALYDFSLDEILLGKTYFKGVWGMKSNYSDAQIEQLIKKHYSAAHIVRPLSGGLVSQTYCFSNDGEKYVFQIGGKREAYAKEKLVSERYRGILPVRNVIGVYSTDNDTAYCVSSYIEGDKLFDLSDQAQIDIVPSVMALFERISTVEIPERAGYGRYDEKGYARFATWTNFVMAICDDKLYDWKALENKGFEIAVVNQAISALEKHMRFIDLDRPYLVHGDVGSYNLLAQGKYITGAIDWSLSLYGDCLYDVANVFFWNEDKLQPLISEMRKKYLMDEHCKKKIFCYILRIGLEEIYNTVVQGEIGYDVEWVMARLKSVTESFV